MFAHSTVYTLIAGVANQTHRRQPCVSPLLRPLLCPPSSCAARVQVVAAAGNLYFTAAATPSGLLYTWRSKGTPLLPPLALGCPPVSLSAEGPWSLLVVGSDGGLLTLDLSKVCVAWVDAAAWQGLGCHQSTPSYSTALNPPHTDGS
jgi:hypothetical protein